MTSVSVESEWGLSDWRNYAACFVGGYDPDLWSSPHKVYLGQAAWICNHACPVNNECLRWALANPDMVDRTVFGGVLWGNGRPALTQPRPRRPPTISQFEKQTPLFPHIGEIRELVEDGVSFTDIAEIFGESTAAVRAFVTRYRGHPEWETSE